MFYLYVPFHGDGHRLPEGYTELVAALAQCDACGYFYCGRIFDPARITE